MRALLLGNTLLGMSEPEENAAAARAAGAVGAIPPTEGVPPEDAAGGPTTRERSAAEDLADGIDLLLRAARKAVGKLDPAVEEAAEAALRRLQALDAGMTREFEKQASRLSPKLEQVARETGNEVAALVQRLARRIETHIPT